MGGDSDALISRIHFEKVRDYDVIMACYYRREQQQKKEKRKKMTSRPPLNRKTNLAWGDRFLYELQKQNMVVLFLLGFYVRQFWGGISARNLKRKTKGFCRFCFVLMDEYHKTWLFCFARFHVQQYWGGISVRIRRGQKKTSFCSFVFYYG